MYSIISYYESPRFLVVPLVENHCIRAQSFRNRTKTKLDIVYRCISFCGIQRVMWPVPNLPIIDFPNLADHS